MVDFSHGAILRCYGRSAGRFYHNTTCNSAAEKPGDDAAWVGEKKTGVVPSTGSVLVNRPGRLECGQALP